MKNGCAYGQVNRGMITEIKDDIKEIKEEIQKISNHYAQRLPTWGTTILAVLVGLLGAALGFILK